VQVAGEPGPREELFDDNQDARAINEENGSQAEDDMLEAEAYKEPVIRGIQSGLHTSTQIESRNDSSAERREGRGYDSKINNAAPSFPYFEYLHPPSSVLQPPPSHPLEQPHVSPQAEHHKSSAKDSSEADNEMLDSDGYSTPPQPIPQRVHQTRRNHQTPTAANNRSKQPQQTTAANNRSKQPQQTTAANNLQSPSLFASQLSQRDMTPSSQSTDPQARLEITDSQPASIPPPTSSRFSAQPSTPPSKQTPNPALSRRRTNANYRTPGDPRYHRPRRSRSRPSQRLRRPICLSRLSQKKAVDVMPSPRITQLYVIPTAPWITAVAVLAMDLTPKISKILPAAPSMSAHGGERTVRRIGARVASVLCCLGKVVLCCCEDLILKHRHQ